MKLPFGDLMKQAQQMQERMQQLQRELEQAVVTGESGAGLVKVEMNGRHDVRRVDIDPAMLDEREVLQDLVAAAINDAVRKVEALHRERVGELTGGIPIPGFGPLQ